MAIYIIKKITLTLLLVLVAIATQAQIIMTGSIKNEKGSPMEGAYITIEGTNIATLSDLEGNYKLTVPSLYAGFPVTFNYAGYLVETLEVRDGKFDVVMRDRETQRIADIYVSTQKRLQSTVEVPIAVSVIDSTKIRMQNLYSIDDMSHLVPGFNTIISSDLTAVYGIRGVTSKGAESYGQSRISVYLDGVSISRIQNSYIELYDMERVEAVKGPQGTLFGRGAEHGAVHFIRKKPTDQFGVDLSVLYGLYNERKVVGVLNTPAGDVFSNRFAFDYNAHDGYIKNNAGGKLNGQNTIALRNISSFHIGSKLDMHLAVDYQHDDNPGASYQCKTQFNEDGEIIDTDKSPFTTANLTLGDDLYLKRDLAGFSGQIDFNLGEHFDINSTTGIRYYDIDELYDIDGTALNILNGNAHSNGYQVSQEFRCNWNIGKKLNGFFGASYFYERAEHKYKMMGNLHYIYPLAVGRNMRTSLSGLPEQILATAASIIENWTAEKKQDPEYAAIDIESLDNLAIKLQTRMSERVRAQIPIQLSQWFDVIYWDKTPEFYDDTKNVIEGILYEVIDELVATDPVAAAIVAAHPAEDILKSIDIGAGIKGLIPFSGLELNEDHYEDETDYNHTKEASAFADFSWNFYKNFHLTFGLRGTYETLETGYFSSSLTAPMLGSIIYANTGGQTLWVDKSYTSVVGRLVFNWMFNPTHNLYLSAARGRRPGMIYYNYKPDEVISLSPETTMSYELGIKGTTKYGHLNYAIALYYYNWEHFQTLVGGKGTSESGSLAYISDDNGKAYGTGIEASGLYTFNPNVNIFADFAYNGGTFADEDMNGNAQGNAGNIFEMFPQYTFDIGFNWKKELSGSKVLYICPSIYTQSRIYFDQENTEDLTQGSYLLINANAGIQWTKGRIMYDMGVCGRNLTNTKYLVDVGNAGAALGLPTSEVGAPATVALSFRMSLR
ncbi:MAG: TonB-dependent receptor [Bacteroidales bacterium]|nr:TonB-dependent receptor [Bacteroidales bacterium]